MINGNPIAQTFYLPGIQSSGLPGVFLTQIGIFFKTKSDTVGVSVTVVENNNGVPNINKRLGSASLNPYEITISNDSSSETIFTFSYPLMLSADTTYSFYITPNSNTPDYNVWVSEVGGIDVISGQQITEQPYAGTLYVSNNGDSWVPVQTQDIKFNLYVANFSSSTGTAIFRNQNYEYITLDLSSTGGIYHKTSGVGIAVGDMAYAANSANISQTLTSNLSIYPVGRVNDIDEVSGKLTLERYNGLWSNTTYKNIRFYRPPNNFDTNYITSSFLIANAIISTIDDIYYEALVPKFTITEPSGTYTKSLFYGTSNTTFYPASNKDSTGSVVANETLHEYHDFQRVVKSFSNEIALGTFGTKGTATYEIQLTSLNQFQSPVIDLNAKTFNFIHNRINNDGSNEYTNYGNALARYISKTIILDTVSEDFKLWITGYRPIGTDIQIYVKFINNDSDSELFDTKDWTPLDYINNTGSLYSSPQDSNDYKEYCLGLPQSLSQPSSPSPFVAYGDIDGDIVNDVAPGTLTYYDRGGVMHRGFNTFAIKIVLLSDNVALYPNMRDVRSVALMM